MAAIDRSSLSPVDRAAAAGTLLETINTAGSRIDEISLQMTQNQLLVTAASTVEAAGYVQQPSVKSTTATSKRSSLIVAAFAGLIVGVILALLWDRPPARERGLMSTRSCPDWPDLMERAPDLLFKHYTADELSLPSDVVVALGPVRLSEIEVCADTARNVFNPDHTDPALAEALRSSSGATWRAGRGIRLTLRVRSIPQTGLGAAAPACR